VLRQIGYAISARIDVVQIREDDLEGRALFDLVGAAVALARGSATRILVNDRVDVAVAAGAAGVHLKAASMPAPMARRLAPAGFLVGQSVHSVEEAVAAGETVDYLIAGTVWPTESKSAGHMCLGPGGLAGIARAARIPVLAIGGVSRDRIPAVARTGAAGIAGIGLFIGPPVPSGGCRARPLTDTISEARTLFARGLQA
jgi:thiamine-phosphate pyrophosphorylase